jgi:DNA-binding NtrC family response regulator
MESELFGHEKGAYTGAHSARPGHIEEAHTGTLFLDEIGTLPLPLQSKLLRVLEEHTVQRLGSKTSKKIDFRLITATNDDLETMVRAGRFREDLYYRINVIPIQLPALRERAGDIPLLADHFMRIYSVANGVDPKRFDKETLEILEENPWKGNIRELENLIQRLVLMVRGPVIKPEHLPSQILYSSTSRQQELLIPEAGIVFDDEMRKIECAYLQAALQRSGGKKTAAAVLLGIPVQRMKYLCRKYNLNSD